MDLEPADWTNDEGQERGTRADAAAVDLIKQLITLAAGVLALSATFLERSGPLSPALLLILGGSWLALILSVFGGIQAMSAIVKSRLSGDNEWSKGHGKKYASTSKYGFLIGIALFALFAFILLVSVKSPVEHSIDGDPFTLLP